MDEYKPKFFTFGQNSLDLALGKIVSSLVLFSIFFLDKFMTDRCMNTQLAFLKMGTNMDEMGYFSSSTCSKSLLEYCCRFP